MASENSPLLAYRLLGEEGVAFPANGAGGPGGASARKLSTFLGVVVPTVLSMFSIVVFLRIGFVVGHAGLLQALAMLLVAYFILALTVLSVCAIATNGAVRGGGAYFMISRTLGPEVGGSIGLMFYLANVCGCAVSLLGLVEAVLDIFGADATGSSGLRVLPQGYGWSLLYGSVLLGLVGGVCTLGAGLYARASFLTFLLVSGSLASVLVSFVAVGPRNIPLTPRPGPNGSSLPPQFGHFTGFNSSTLKANLGAGYAKDYTTGAMMTFASVFAVLFNGCTGIMAGANMSGELKDPSRAIPLGTIVAVAYTFFIYILLFFLSSFTCDRTLLQEDYGFFRAISLWPPLVLIGVYATSLSASMSSLIGASRILHALAQDDLFGVILAPAKVVSQGGNPWGAVLYSWALVQLLLLVGNPRGALPLLRLANQLKKGGLYVLGHVTLGDLDCLPSDPVQPQYGAWLSLVDRAQVKAFVDLTLSPSVRQGAQHLLRISGLGGMKPNTLVLGFYDDAAPQDHFLTDPAFSEPAGGTQEGGTPALSTLFPPPRAPGSPRALTPQDYVATVADALKMNKNVVLARACGALPPERLSRGSGGTSQPHHVDVWPLNLLRPRGGPGYVDVCGLFLLQMATILGMVPAWHSARLRIFLCLGPREAPGAAEGRLRALLSQLRIRAEVQEVVWGEGAGSGQPEEEEEGDFVNSGRGDAEAEALACSANALVRAQQARGRGGGPGGPEGGNGVEGPATALTFLYLPRPPADSARYPRYLALLEILSRDLGPTLLIHGVTPVTCTDL
ncbi:PREDICTED: solute carrier family 12 member 9 isoform X2 [Ceratotherium simum simum]|uniref:Solute carrier family 12 member 9 n=1 Tax=Ceratotherium simum simum TaxID=73337 RepID=A0ABM1DLF0_CERSS|nr:PREDICTED: solute carrier family 12 member 9 isoform X2 [Ceratotherium simum simum]